MVRKKILFVIPSLNLGGAEKSIINLLNALDHRKYDAEIFVMTKVGPLLQQIPDHVKILEASPNYSRFSQSVFKSFFEFLMLGEFRLAIKRGLFAFWNRYYKNVAVSEQQTWKYVQDFFARIEVNYDVAIGYLEKSTIYFIADKVTAEKKIGWIHTDLEAIKLDFGFEKKYLRQLDYIITVSEGLSSRLRKVLPELSGKIKTVENINSAKFIRKQAEAETSVVFDNQKINLIYVGRLVKEKGLYNALNALKILVKINKNIIFHIAGDGELKDDLQHFVNDNNLSSNVVFLGMQSNPYPLIKKADIFLLTSFYEGKSISLEEAKILKKPIVVTSFTSAKDQIKDFETGLIADMNPQSIADKIELLIQDSSLRNKIIDNLENEDFDTEKEIEKLYKLIED